MNPTNPFGSPQGGAFQVTNSTMKTGLFQPFGQQMPSNQPQTMGFFPSSAFGQPSALNQPRGNAVFGQGPSFGQPSKQPASLPSQTPAFGQPGFSSSSTPAFGQSGGSNQSQMFGQTPAFGQPSAFGQGPGFGQQAPGFGKPPPAYGEQTSGFGNSQIASGTATPLGQPQPLGFGPFGQPPSTSGTTNVFGPPQTQSKGFGTEFSFKPANDALFKPIFSASPEPGNPQTTSMSSSPFGASETQTKSSTMSTSGAAGFSVLTGEKSGPLGFSFSQPAAAPSISAQNNPLTTGKSSSPTNLQFTFSQPAAPSSTNTNAPTTQPTTPSSFSFSAKALQPQPVSLFRGASTGQPSAFGGVKAKADSGADSKANSFEGMAETNVFARLGSKSTKRKDDTANPDPELVAEEEETTEGDAPRQPPKRPLIRSRGPPGGIFGRALSGLRRDVTPPATREGRTTQQQTSELELEKEDTQSQGDPAATQLAVPPVTRDVPPKVEESVSAEAPKMLIKTTTPMRRGVRRESSDSGLSPTDCTVLQCRNLRLNLNKKDILERHFSRFGKVSKVLCRPAKNMAIVHFDDHVSAARAKKKGKMLHKQELLLLWQRKKQSPGDKSSTPAADQEQAEGEILEDTQSHSSPLRRPQVRAPAVGSMVTFSRSSPVKRSSLAKSLQFDSDPKESPSEAQSSERTVPSSLLHLIGQVTETAEDKYRLLEQRDKVLRQGRPKRQDLDLSKVFVGTCPDMCPEKERYMRETRKQLSTFEVIPNTEMVDHAAAIKEYSRSSADQEEPLPHDLRPLPVLSMTMDYLVTRIMDQGFDNFRDWYDFVWNRTRGIRKDITQQRLCCPLTVSLIEKCTRFHVHCAHHLCEEPLSAFDPKINNENMTKCLQSLKEMYEDLQSRNIYCPREAEFRQYNVLLKLNDGDILREVQQFRDEVRNSPEVKFAVQVFAALDSNNFVRFFKLVKGASYLASCLLHRYFNQVRAKALKTLIMAHTMGPRSSTAFPLEDIVRMLMFHDAEEAADVLQQYGLNVNDGLVELSRVAYQELELPLSHKKSDIILAKKTMLIGEVVNGSSLPTPPQHTPVCSFDSQNKYRGEGPLAEPTSNQFKDIAVKVEVKPLMPSVGLLPQVVPTKPAELKPPSLFGLPSSAETGEPDESYQGLPGPAAPLGGQQLFQPIFQPEPVKPPSPPPKPTYSDEDINAEVDSVIDEFVDAEVMEVATAGATYATTALAESSVQVESLVSEVLGQMLQEISADEFRLEQQCVAEEKRKLEEARRKQEHEAFLVEFSFSLCKDIIHEVLDETIKDTATSEIQQALDDKAQCVAKCTEQVCTSLVEETLNADISLLIEEILNVELQRIYKYIKRWRDVVAVRRQLKRQMRGFPASPCCVDPRFKLKALAPSAPAQASLEDLVRGVVNLGNAGTLALSSTRVLKMRRDAMHQMRVHYYYQHLLDKMVWSPLDLPALVMGSLDNPPDRIFWKAVLLLPSDDESVASPADRILSDWLEVKLGGNKESKVTEEKLDGALQNLCVSNTLQENGEHTHKVHLSIKVSRGPLTEDGLSKMEECYDLQGTGALVLLLPALPIADPKHDEQDVPLLSALLQLKQLQQASTWHCPLPLVVLVPGPDSGDSLKLEEALMLHKLVQEGLISEYTFVFIPETTSDPEGSKQLNHAMRWLVARAPPCFPLSCQTLVQLVEATLSHEFSPRVHAHRQERNSARLPPQDPGPVIRLYNAVLTHVADRVSSPELCRLSWPPGEFCLQDNREFVPHLGWNSPLHLAWLREAILSLQLPECEDVSAIDSWSEQCSAIFRYAAQIPATHCSQPLLISRIDNLLERVRGGYPIGTPVSTATSGTQGRRGKRVTPPPGQIPWDDVVVMCIDHKLKDWQIPGPPVCEDAVTEDGEIFVYLPKESVTSFEAPEEWTEAVRQTHREKQEEITGATAAACITPTGHFPRQRLFQSFVEPVEAPPAPLDISHTPTTEELLAHKVLQNLEEEKAESKRSMEQLRRWMEGDTLGNWSTSLFLPSSTLLSMPATIIHTSAAKARHPTEDPEPDDLLDKANWKKPSPLSMTKQLKELERQILASQEEELACRLKLSGMLSIVDD